MEGQQPQYARANATIPSSAGRGRHRDWIPGYNTTHLSLRTNTTMETQAEVCCNKFPALGRKSALAIQGVETEGEPSRCVVSVQPGNQQQPANAKEDSLRAKTTTAHGAGQGKGYYIEHCKHTLAELINPHNLSGKSNWCVILGRVPSVAIHSTGNWGEAPRDAGLLLR